VSNSSDELTATSRVTIGTVVACSAAVCVYAIRQADPDLFGYLVYGRFFIQHGLYAPDPFAYTSPGLHWVAFEYLAQIVLWLAYSAIGPVGLIALKCIIGGLTIYLLSTAVRTTTSNPIIWVPVFLLCTSTVSRYFVFRPQLFTFMFFALYVAVLFRLLVTGAAPLWLLPLAMLVWANLHGGFLAGLAAIALVIALRLASHLTDFRQGIQPILGATKALWLTMAVCLAVTLVNPYGLSLWRYVSTEVLHGTNRLYIAEWQPPGLDSDPWSAAALLSMTVVLLIAGAAAQICHRRVAGLAPWLWVISCAPATALASISVRHVPLAALWIAPVITLLASSAWKTHRAAAFNVAWVAIGGCSLIPLVVTLNYVLADPRPNISSGGVLLGETHPCTAVAFMKRNHIRGNVFLPLWWGSYLTWELYPEIKVSMDGRNISLFSGEMVRENLRFYSNDVTRGDLDAPRRYDTDYLLVPAARPVLQMIREDVGWREVFRDSQASLFVRMDSDHVALPSPSLILDQRNPSDCASVLR
jgi:hypothetical protein